MSRSEQIERAFGPWKPEDPTAGMWLTASQADRCLAVAAERDALSTTVADRDRRIAELEAKVKERDLWFSPKSLKEWLDAASETERRNEELLKAQDAAEARIAELEAALRDILNVDSSITATTSFDAQRIAARALETPK